MKLRNFANKFLLVTMMLLLVLGNFALPTVTSAVVMTPASTATSTQLTKTYRLDSYNLNQPTSSIFHEETLYSALGIKTYNNYLMQLSATQNLNDIVVAVVDTGLDDDQVLFKDRVLTDYGMDFSYGLATNVYGESNAWDLDENGHGTHVAGIIADITLSNVKILPIKIFHGKNNTIDLFAFVNALLYLRALKTGVPTQLYQSLGGNNYTKTKEYYPLSSHGENFTPMTNLVVANFSLGVNGFTVDEITNAFIRERNFYQNLIDYCLLQVGILPVVAAGNRTEEQIDSEAYYSLPGSCSGVLEVSWYDNGDNRYTLAQKSYYNNNVSLAAPGSNIWSACSAELIGDEDVDVKTDGENYYYCCSGTSMATPFVTACYAMLMSDSSKTQAADFGLSSFDPSATDSDDDQYVSVQHKALLAAALQNGHGKTDRFGQRVHEYEPGFGYGTLTVACFGTNTVSALADIKYEPFDNTTKDSASLPDVRYLMGGSQSTDWFRVCVIIALVVLIIWGIKMFRTYSVALIRRKEANDNDDEQQSN